MAKKELYRKVTSVKVDHYTMQVIEHIQKKAHEDTGYDITKKDVMKCAVVQYAKLKQYGLPFVVGMK